MLTITCLLHAILTVMRRVFALQCFHCMCYSQDVLEVQLGQTVLLVQHYPEVLVHLVFRHHHCHLVSPRMFVYNIIHTIAMTQIFYNFYLHFLHRVLIVRVSLLVLVLPVMGTIQSVFLYFHLSHHVSFRSLSTFPSIFAWCSSRSLITWASWSTRLTRTSLAVKENHNISLLLGHSTINFKRLA